MDESAWVLKMCIFISFKRNDAGSIWLHQRFNSHNSPHRKHITNGQMSRFWKDRDPECHPHLQTKPLPENPPLMKWTGQCNKAWAKHLSADYYYLVNKGRRRMRMPHYMSDYFIDYSDVQWSKYLILQCFTLDLIYGSKKLWNREIWIKTY